MMARMDAVERQGRAKLQSAELFREFRQNQGWQVFESIMQERMALAVNALCDEKCSDRDGHCLRAEIALLKLLLHTPDLMDSEIEAWQKKMTTLREGQDKMHTYGWRKHPSQEDPRHEEPQRVQDGR